MLIAIFWITFGALVGWIVCVLQGWTAMRTLLTYALFGAVGGLLGGLLSNKLSFPATDHDSSPVSLMFSVFGALLVSTIVGHSTGDPRGQKR